MKAARSKCLLDHYEHPRNVGSLDEADEDVATAMVRSKSCGDLLRLQVRVDSSRNVIREVRFKAFGCGAAIAAGSFATEWLADRTLQEASRFNPATLVSALRLARDQVHCARLVKETISAVIVECRRKHASGQRKNSLTSRPLSR